MPAADARVAAMTGPLAVALLDPMLMAIQASGVAQRIRISLALTAGLSAVHLLGVALIGGAAILSALRLSGLLFGDRPLEEIIRPAGRVILVGLAISATTGVLQFAPRAVDAAANGYFQLKLVTLVLAAACYLTLYLHVARSRHSSAVGAGTRLLGITGSLLWIGVVAAGSAFILFE